jgi:hypothetical protein
MNFNVKDEVEYRGRKGTVTFVDPCYIVITLPASEGHNPPGIIVFTDRQKNVYLVDSK